MNKNQKPLLSFIIGAAAGAAAGLLLAPSTGKETRKKLADEATSLKDKVEKEVKSASDLVTSTVKNTIAKSGKEVDKETNKVN